MTTDSMCSLGKAAGLVTYFRKFLLEPSNAVVVVPSHDLYGFLTHTSARQSIPTNTSRVTKTPNLNASLPWL